MASYGTGAPVKSRIPKPSGHKMYQSIAETSRDGNDADSKPDSGGISGMSKSTSRNAVSIYAVQKRQRQQEWGSFRKNLEERRKTKSTDSKSQASAPKLRVPGSSSQPAATATGCHSKVAIDEDQAYVSPDSGYVSTKDMPPPKPIDLPACSVKEHESGLIPSKDAVASSAPNVSLIPVLSPLTQGDNYCLVNGYNYRILNQIGKGGSSQVFQVYDEERKLCLAIKRVNLTDADETVVTAYRNEIALLKRLQKYPHRVVRMYDYEYAENEQQLYVVMEKGDTDLASLFKNEKDDQSAQTRQNAKLPEHMIAFYWLEMLKAVQVIHQEGIIHSDLKPANFLLVAGKLKLIDFGIANAVPANKTSVTRECQMGTLNYISPEAVSYDIKHKVSVKSDVWSLGCILYNMVYGRTPFQHIQNPMSKMAAMLDRRHAIPFPTVSDAKVIDVMKRCLERDPKQRAGIDELLQHPYINSRDGGESAFGSVTDDNLRELAETISKATPDTGARLIKAAIQNAKGDKNKTVERLAMGNIKF